MKRAKPKMTHNDRFFFSQFCVGSSQELAERALQHERAISQLQVASENSLLCAFQFHTRCWIFYLFYFIYVFLVSFKSCHCVFKDCTSLKKSVCHRWGSRRNQERETGLFYWYKRGDLIRNKTTTFTKIVQGQLQAGHWFISVESITPPGTLFVTHYCPNSLMLSLWEPLTVDRSQTG